MTRAQSTHTHEHTHTHFLIVARFYTTDIIMIIILKCLCRPYLWSETINSLGIMGNRNDVTHSSVTGNLSGESIASAFGNVDITERRGWWNVLGESFDEQTRSSTRRLWTLGIGEMWSTASTTINTWNSADFVVNRHTGVWKPYAWANYTYFLIGNKLRTNFWTFF